MNQECRVCHEPAAGFHFGAFTCEGCKVRAESDDDAVLNVMRLPDKSGLHFAYADFVM